VKGPRRSAPRDPLRPFDDGRLYSLGEVAEVLSVDRSTVDRWVSRGFVRGLRAGRSVRVPGCDLNAFMEPIGAPVGGRQEQE
jgi:excisionase family DNA binding protein